MKKGDIVLTPFPFTDLSETKFKPALIISLYKDDVVLAFISSIINRVDTYEILIKKSGKNGLKTDSILKLNKLITLDRKIVVGKIGELENNILKEAGKLLLKLFEIS